VEILEELDEIAAFVAGLGTGGTLMGNGRRLKEELGDAVKIVAVEPMQGEPVQGLRSLDDGFIPPIIDLSLLDRKIFVTNRDAIVWTRKLLEEEGIFAGVSSGAIAAITVRSPASSTRAMSSSSCATTGGSTSRRASTPPRSTRSRTSTRPCGGRPPGGAPEAGRAGRFSAVRGSPSWAALPSCSPPAGR
jgi:threonine dehydratase